MAITVLCCLICIVDGMVLVRGLLDLAEYGDAAMDEMSQLALQGAHLLNRAQHDLTSLAEHCRQQQLPSAADQLLVRLASITAEASTDF